MNEAREELNDAQFRYLALLLDAGCKFLFRTEKWGKTYVWMKDSTGNIFLERVPDSA